MAHIRFLFFMFYSNPGSYSWTRQERCSPGYSYINQNSMHRALSIGCINFVQVVGGDLVSLPPCNCGGDSVGFLEYVEQ